MNIEDIIISPQKITTEKWQIGDIISDEILENSIVLLFVSDFRGMAGGNVEIQDFSKIRKIFYTFSKQDFEIPICDLGSLISGKTLQDTHYVLQEILTLCHKKNAIPVIVGGSNDFAYSLFFALNFYQKNIRYTQISHSISLESEGEEISEKNYLNKIFSTKDFSIKEFHLLGYQKHINEEDLIKLIKEVDFDMVRLAEMMNSTERTEPYFRNADLVTINCDAIESFSEAFSVHPQVNGLNRREICAYMKEIGLSENLKSVGIFNYNFEAENALNHQLLAQMLWYLVEGINIQKSHPKEKNFETFWVLADDREYAFKRDTFSNLWYFARTENREDWVACSKVDFEDAKRGMLHSRFLKI